MIQNRRSRGVLFFCCLLLGAIGAHEATAATRASGLAVCVDVAENCTISFDSGRLAADDTIPDRASNTTNGSRSVAVKCTSGTDPEIAVARVQTETDYQGSRRTIVATVTF